MNQPTKQMADFADNATVALKLEGTPYPAIALDDLPTIPRGDAVEVEGSVGKEMLSLAAQKEEIPEDAISAEVIESGAGPDEGLIDAVGEKTAQNLATEAGIFTLAEARAADDGTLTDVTGVGEATVANKIRASEEPEDGEG